MAAVLAIKDFYPYLYEHSFTLVNDHNPLTSLKTLNGFGGHLTRWPLFLQQFDFRFQYKQETTHTNVDSLFHRSPVPVTFISELKLPKDPTSIHKPQDDDLQLRNVISALVQLWNWPSFVFPQ